MVRVDRFGIILVCPFTDPNIGSKTSDLLYTEDEDCENPEPPVEFSDHKVELGRGIHTKVPWTSNKAPVQTI